MSASSGSVATPVSIDPEHPWLGLSSYTEETRAYFHGRDDEAAELARRVQRKNLTVLFGQSGLGKTSLLRAGLVPRLRGEGYCPVYVRIDYAPESPPPAEQIKQAIFRTTAAAGAWTRPGTAIEGESLWEFLHHRGDLLRDADGRTLLPLLIFDQFEEIFTLAQADDSGRLRAKQFLEELADLVENRPPLELERRLEQDDAAAEDFDFARADYRILIALREDYLAHLESLKGTMPSITQNRMRLARMTGAQALSAVMKPGGRLVNQEVAEAIVRFVAGGAELANAEVEPSLLSLVCRELNNLRIAKGRSEISADLLAGSRDTILTEFYERALEDQPPGVRRVVEDELLTESGYRESLAEERVVKALAEAGAAPDALAKLVDRRLLRIEERLDVRRVELTHDVLCSVVRASRDLRHEREARDEAERQLEAQREREAETRRALGRTRRVAVVSAVLMLIALASSIFGWINYRRAHQADLAAQQARADAEKLVGFLIEDFYEELEPTGRVETMGKLAQKAVDYYNSLPAELLTPQTQAYRGMALVRLAGAAYARDDVDNAVKIVDEAQATFERLRDSGDESEPVALGLALALFTPHSAWGPGGGPGAKPGDLRRAADLLRAHAQSAQGSRQAKIIYADILNFHSHELSKEEAVEVCEEARQVLSSVGALDLTDLTATSVYADTADSQARHALALGRIEDTARLEQQVYDLAEKVLAQRPGDLRSMRNRALAADLLGVLAARRHDRAAAADFARKAERAGEDYVRFNPSDMSAWTYWIRGKGMVADILFEEGRIQDALAVLRGAVALENDARRPATLLPQLNFAWARVAGVEARLGQRAASEASLRAAARAHEESLALTAQVVRREVLASVPDNWRARRDWSLGDTQAAFDRALAVLERVRGIDVADDTPNNQAVRNNVLRFTLTTASLSALRLGRLQQAEALARERLDLPPDPFSDADPRDEAARATVVLAQAIAMQGRAAEALALVQPEIERYRAEQKAGATGTTFERDVAYAYYVAAVAQSADAAGRARRATHLAASAAALARLSDEARQLSDVREIAGLVDAARRDTTG